MFKLRIDGHEFEVETEQLVQIATKPIDDFIENAPEALKQMLKAAASMGFARYGITKPRGVDTFDFIKGLIFGGFVDFIEKEGMTLGGRRIGEDKTQTQKPD